VAFDILWLNAPMFGLRRSASVGGGFFQAESGLLASQKGGAVF
jgi:hypothetical protein